jgi:hypothetical protein
MDCIAASTDLFTPPPSFGIEVLNPPGARTRDLLKDTTNLFDLCLLHFCSPPSLRGLPPSFAHFRSVALSYFAALALPPFRPVLPPSVYLLGVLGVSRSYSPKTFTTNLQQCRNQKTKTFPESSAAAKGYCLHIPTPLIEGPLHAFPGHPLSTVRNLQPRSRTVIPRWSTEAWRTRLWLVSGWECRGRRLSRARENPHRQYEPW